MTIVPVNVNSVHQIQLHVMLPVVVLCSCSGNVTIVPVNVDSVHQIQLHVTLPVVVLCSFEAFYHTEPSYTSILREKNPAAEANCEITELIQQSKTMLVL